MRMSIPVRKLSMGLMAVLALGSGGCSAAYWQDIANFSPIVADVGTPGRIEWEQERDDQTGVVVDAKPTSTDPAVILSMPANSSPVTYTTAQADFFYTEGNTDTGRLAANPMDIASQFFQFTTQLKNLDRATAPTTKTVTLHGLIPNSLVQLTNPVDGAGGQILTAAIATVTLTGTNGFGASIKTKVNIPINISYKN